MITVDVVVFGGGTGGGGSGAGGGVPLSTLQVLTRRSGRTFRIKGEFKFKEFKELYIKSLIYFKELFYS